MTVAEVPYLCRLLDVAPHTDQLGFGGGVAKATLWAWLTTRLRVGATIRRPRESFLAYLRAEKGLAK